MTVMSRRGRLGMVLAVLVASMSGCSTVEVDIGYAPDVPVLLSEDEAATFEVGQFTDRREKSPFWVGEIQGAYYYPKSILATDRSLSEIVRDTVEQGAFDRDMLNERGNPRRYQFYGHIERLDGIESDAAVVHVHLVSRLLDLAENREVYTANHRIERATPLDNGNASDLESLIEEALNEVVANSLDDPKLREALLAAGEDS